MIAFSCCPFFTLLTLVLPPDTEVVASDADCFCLVLFSLYYPAFMLGCVA